LNTYGYVGGNPLRYFDPLGLQGCDRTPNSWACAAGLPYTIPPDIRTLDQMNADQEKFTYVAAALPVVIAGAWSAPELLVGYTALSEAIVLSNTSIITGTAIRSTMASAYETAICLGTEATVYSLPLVTNPTFQSQFVDFINAIPEGPFNFTYGGFFGSQVGGYIREDLLR